MSVQDNFCQELIKGLNEDQIDVRSNALEGKLRGWYWFLSVTRPPHRGGTCDIAIVPELVSVHFFVPNLKENELVKVEPSPTLVATLYDAIEERKARRQQEEERKNRVNTIHELKGQILWNLKQGQIVELK